MERHGWFGATVAEAPRVDRELLAAVHPERTWRTSRRCARAAAGRSTPTPRRCPTPGRRRCARRAGRPRWSTRCSAARRERACRRCGRRATTPSRSGRWGSASSTTRPSPPSGRGRRTGVSRVLILDWDVHHGNGTKAIFAADPDVLFVSIHEWPLYPGTGPATDAGGGGRGLHGQPAGAGRDGRRRVPLAGRARRGAADRAPGEPQLVLVSAGLRRPPRRPARDLPGHRGGLRGHGGVAAAGLPTRSARRSGSCSRAATTSARWPGRWPRSCPCWSATRRPTRARSSGTRWPPRRLRRLARWWPDLAQRRVGLARGGVGARPPPAEAACSATTLRRRTAPVAPATCDERPSAAWSAARWLSYWPEKTTKRPGSSELKSSESRIADGARPGRRARSARASAASARGRGLEHDRPRAAGGPAGRLGASPGVVVAGGDGGRRPGVGRRGPPRRGRRRAWPRAAGVTCSASPASSTSASTSAIAASASSAADEQRPARASSAARRSSCPTSAPHCRHHSCSGASADPQRGQRRGSATGSAGGGVGLDRAHDCSPGASTDVTGVVLRAARRDRRRGSRAAFASAGGGLLARRRGLGSLGGAAVGGRLVGGAAPLAGRRGRAARARLRLRRLRPAAGPQGRRSRLGAGAARRAWRAALA